ncbi:MAG: hypothetical protein ACJ8EC_16810, partial [Microvirga sp.]
MPNAAVRRSGGAMRPTVRASHPAAAATERAEAPASRRRRIASHWSCESRREVRASGQRVHPFFCASTLTVLAPTPV